MNNYQFRGINKNNSYYLISIYYMLKVIRGVLYIQEEWFYWYLISVGCNVDLCNME